MNANTKRALQLDDLFAIGIVSDPQISPSATHITWVETRLDKDEDTYRAAIWIANADGSSPRKLTSGTQRDTNPRWSPDGRSIAFVSNRKPAREPVDFEKPEDSDKKPTGTPDADAKPLPQIWVISLDGGEAMQATNHPGGASSPTWSADGAALAFVASDKVNENDPFNAPITTGTYADERVVNDIRYRFDGRGWLESFSHIWTVPVASTGMTQRTFGDANDSQPAWSPDGTSLVFTRSPRQVNATGRSSSIFLLNLASGASSAVMPLDGSFDSPAFSPNGKQLAFFDSGDPNVNGLNVKLGTIELDGSKHQIFDGSVDLSFGDFGMSDVSTSSDGLPRWVDDSSIAFLVSRQGETQIHKLDLTKNKLKPLTSGKRRIMGFDLNKGDLAFVSGEIHKPTELFIATANGKKERQITSANSQYLSEVRLSEAINLDVTSADGQKIQAWLMPPHDYNPENPARYPLIVQIHGGPHAMYSYAMFHEMQLMAAKNYGVVFCNPRGSSGYGEHFTMCTRGTWGESDMPDVMATLEAALEQPWVDPDRLGVTGGSYGGYLTNWIIGHTTRFKAAVTQRCVSNFYSFFGTSDIGFDFGTYESNGLPWANAEQLLKYSPISYVDKIETPLLILHSEQDLRCPIEQSEQMFVSLRYLDREVSFVRIPNEGHELSRSGTPSRRLARLQHLVGWFDTHL
ncbi:MAG: S9 family peptidase [Thermomicrobiales bacterium]